MPTGGGKSICYQVPVLAGQGIGIVISPLVALMKDQVQSLNEKGIKAHAVYSGMPFREMDMILDNSIYGDVRFLYCSPERLQTDLFVTRFKEMPVSLIAVDEAHCISQWGYDFRPAYTLISELRKFHEDVPVLALTASATERVRQDIQDKLEFKSNRNVFIKSFLRKNISYVIRKTDRKFEKLLEVLNKTSGSAIVYVRSRKKTEEIATFLIQNKISASFYHAGLQSGVKDDRQHAWMNNTFRVMVSTNAFGMGIDKPDVRNVIHFDIPDSMESFYQESGRAGRDEKESFAVLIYNSVDVTNIKRQQSLAEINVDFAREVYIALGNYFKLAIGAGKGQTYDFDLFDFSKQYRLNAGQAYNALKLLNDEGYISLSDGFRIPGRIYFKADKTQLYRFQIANKKYEQFIKTILRNLEGVFDQYVPINEKRMASKCGWTEDNFVEGLKFLRKQKIIDYIPPSDKPRITLVTERLPNLNLAFDQKRMEFIYGVRKDNLSAMLKFVDNESICRNRVLLSYFSEKLREDCGKCDICRSRSGTGISNDQFDVLQMHVKNLLKNKALLLEELIMHLDAFERSKIIEVIEWMHQHKEINRGEDQKFTINN